MGVHFSVGKYLCWSKDGGRDSIKREEVSDQGRWLGPSSSVALWRRVARPALCEPETSMSSLRDWPKMVMVAFKLRPVS